jgi:hypothetical protein
MGCVKLGVSGIEVRNVKFQYTHRKYYKLQIQFVKYPLLPVVTGVDVTPGQV